MVTDPQTYFYVNDGTVLKDINDLMEKMKNVDDNVFSHHVNSEKNDFANWTKEVLRDSRLAKSISKAKAPKEILNAIERRLASKERMKNRKEDKRLFIKEIKEAHI